MLSLRILWDICIAGQIDLNLIKLSNWHIGLKVVSKAVLIFFLMALTFVLIFILNIKVNYI